MQNWDPLLHGIPENQNIKSIGVLYTRASSTQQKRGCPSEKYGCWMRIYKAMLLQENRQWISRWSNSVLGPFKNSWFWLQNGIEAIKPATMRFFFWNNSTNSGITTTTPPESQNHECQGKCIPTCCMIHGVASNEYSLQCRHTWT